MFDYAATREHMPFALIYFYANDHNRGPKITTTSYALLQVRIVIEYLS